MIIAHRGATDWCILGGAVANWAATWEDRDGKPSRPWPRSLADAPWRQWLDRNKPRLTCAHEATQLTTTTSGLGTTSLSGFSIIKSTSQV